MMVVHDCPQGGDDWLRVRMGIVTASEFKTIIGVKKDAREKVTRDTYMRKLAGELLTGEPMATFQNADMERGKIIEDEARDMYAFMTDTELQRVGFISNYDAGCSPDSLIGTDGGLEIKSALAHIQIERLLRGELPSEHRAQVQGNIWIAEREYWDFVSYCPKLPLFVKRVFRDDGYIATLSGGVKAFNEELAAMVLSIRGWQPTKIAA